MVSNTAFLIGAGFIAAASIPLILKVVPRNSLYGFRTASTLASDEVWFRANHFAGWALLIAAAASAALIYVVPASARAAPGLEAVIFTAPIVVALVATFAYLRRINRERSK
jgi:uncharacterized membrane protein